MGAPNSNFKIELPFARPSEPVSIDTCSLCECLERCRKHGHSASNSQSQEELISHRYTLFHQECNSCWRHRRSESLCEMCQHMRLGHLFRCRQYEPPLSKEQRRRERLSPFKAKIKFGTWDEVSRRSKNCRVCNSLVKIAAKDGPFDVGLRTEIEIGLYNVHLGMRYDFDLLFTVEDDQSRLPLF